MAVYSPTGSGNVHVDRVISGGRKGTPVAKGMGFKAAAAGVAKKQDVSKAAANAIIAAGARKASPAAKKANPNLAKVKGKAMSDPVKVMKAAPKKGAAGGAMCAEPTKATKAGDRDLPGMVSKRARTQSVTKKARASRGNPSMGSPRTTGSREY